MERKNNNMKSFWKKYGVRIGIIVLSMLFLCTFICRKEGYHLDEILAYELSNAEYNPWIVPTQPVGRLAKFMGEHIDGENWKETISNTLFIIEDTIKNRSSSILANYKADVYETPVWMSKTLFQDYVRCTSKDDFNLFSVYFNVKDDNHPPLYFMCLHLMCSLWKGEISVWHGCVINLIAMAGVLWLLGKIGDLVFEKKTSTYAVMLLSGFSMGMIATSLWIRMYGLLTLWTVWNLYLHMKAYKQQDGFLRWNTKKNKISWIGSWSIFWVTVLSFWTQYFGLFFILPLAAVTVVMLWIKRRTQEMWIYCRTMLTAGITGVAVFPFAISDVFASERGVEAISQWQNGFSEYVSRLKAFGTILAQNVMGSVWIFGLACLIPLVVFVVFRKKNRQSDHVMPEMVLFCMIPTVFYFLLAAKMSPYFIDRYIMAIFPTTALCMVWLWDLAASLVNKRAVWNAMIAAVIGINLYTQVQMQGQHTYLYTGYHEQLEIAETYADYPLVCLYEGSGFYENIMEMERYEQTILLKGSELEQVEKDRTQVTQHGYVALIKYPSEQGGYAQLAKVMDVFGGTTAQLLYEGGAFGDVIYLIQ